MPLLFLVVNRYTRLIKKSSREVRKKEGEIASVIQEVLTSIRVVKAFAREDYEQRRLEEESLESVEIALRARSLKAKLAPLVEIIVAVGTSLVLLFGGRMVLAGTFDRHRRLKVIIGHMGEMLPMMMDRIDSVFRLDIGHLQRPISRTILDHVWITTSGVFNEPPFLAALQTFGIDRIMFSVDYPFAPNMKGRAFLDRISLAPADMAKLTHANVDALLRIKADAR